MSQKLALELAQGKSQGVAVPMRAGAPTVVHGKTPLGQVQGRR